MKSKMNIQIAVVAYNRPDYLRRCLAAIMGMVGFDKYSPMRNPLVFIDCDKNGATNMEVFDICEQFNIRPITTRWNLGCNQNVKRALKTSFEDRMFLPKENRFFYPKADFTIVIEDDIIVSHDAYLYMRWAAERYKDDKDIRTIGMYHGYENEEKPFGVKRQNFFTCWGWGTWRDRWEEMEAEWTTDTEDTHEASWDVIVSSNLRGRKEIVPAISRSYNCGEHKGTHRGRSWPGLTSSGVVDPDGDIKFEEINLKNITL